MLKIPQQQAEWWMDNTQYTRDEPQPFPLGLAGPLGVATVAVFGDGTTSAGWGLQGRKNGDGTREPGFMQKYLKKEFAQKITAVKYRKFRHPFAYVMRSLSIICVDIDGKNGGFDSTVNLGDLPPTLAERSKSGNGVHLFYQVEDEWDEEVGFGRFSDHLGIVQGIDIRATGCVYHYPTQRWNDRPIETLPSRLEQLLSKKETVKRALHGSTPVVLTFTDDEDKENYLMAQMLTHEELLSELEKDVVPGNRNNTLFSIGAKMKDANVPDWQNRLATRAAQLGLADEESVKLLQNIERYT